jgi:hypothetical protein
MNFSQAAMQEVFPAIGFKRILVIAMLIGMQGCNPNPSRRPPPEPVPYRVPAPKVVPRQETRSSAWLISWITRPKENELS